MNKDYNDFLQESKQTTSNLDKSVLEMVHQDLNPSHKIVFFKLTSIQGFIGFITMLFCPQFNLSLTNNFDLFHYFHKTFGHSICMMICGSIFLGSGAVFATYILSQGEVNKIRNSRLLYYMGLSILAISGFMLFGAELYLNLVAFWLMGAIGGGIAVFELSRVMRFKVKKSV